MKYSDSKAIFDESSREEYMKPGFENFSNSSTVKPSPDVDLDGEIYGKFIFVIPFENSVGGISTLIKLNEIVVVVFSADQLHTLLQRISPESESMREMAMPPNAVNGIKKPEPKPKRKLTDEEKVMDMIHCIDGDEDDNKNSAVHSFMKPDLGNKPPNMRMPHYGGAFEGVTPGPKTYRQTFSYQMVRKPDGTLTTSTVVDPSGNTKTVIKRTIDGETKTQTLINGVDIDDANGGGAIGNEIASIKQSNNNWIIDCGRHFYVNKDGYALPKNLF